MPVITAEGESAVVTAWFVDEGGWCDAGALIAEVQAEKVSLDVNAPTGGHVVDRIGINVPVAQGSGICLIAADAPVEGPGSITDAPGGTRAGPGSRPASPAAKRLARELGMDLDLVSGTGPAGRITEQDVMAMASGGSDGSGMTGLRAVIARNMRAAVAETAPVTLFATAGVSVAPDRVTARVVRTVAALLPTHPALNGHREGDRFVSSSVANVSVAIQTPEGLVAPVVRNPAGRSEDEVIADIRDLARRAAETSLAAEDFAGGTFTVTNLGGYGVECFTPIINLPQVAIMGVGSIRSVPVVGEDGDVSVARELTLSLTFDHAFVDGAPAAMFLRDVAADLSR